MTTGYDDQLEAAAAHSRRIVDEAMARLGKTSTEIQATDLHERILGTAVADCEACRHLRNQGPRPCYVILEHKAILCAPCLKRAPNPNPRPPTCEWCGHGPTTNVLVVNYGQAIIIGAACDECDRHLTA